MKTCREEGYVLIATLWFVALLSLAALLIEGWVAASLESGAALGARVAAHAAMLSAEQRVAFTLASGTASSRGVELASAARSGAFGGASARPFVALDDRPYRIGDVMVRLQDGAGLLDINDADRNTLGAVLKRFGTPETARDALVSALINYRRKRQDNPGAGARGLTSGEGGMRNPWHAPLSTPWELLRVPGWEARSELWQPAASIAGFVTLGPVGAVNVNTAPARILAALGGIDASEAERLIRARAAGPLTSLDQATTRELRTGDENPQPSFLPANIIRLQFAAPDEPRIRVLQLRVTPAGMVPVRVDFATELPRAATGWALSIPLAAAWPSDLANAR